jgi:DNA-binding CsgD family transcriptional regulator/ArsR family metal-binding transcriptional regulator
MIVELKYFEIAQMGDILLFSSFQNQKPNSRIIEMDGVDFLEKMDFTKSYDTLELLTFGPLVDQSAKFACGSYGARFQMDCDLSPLFPYINAVADHAQFYEKPVHIKFVLEKRLCSFNSMEAAFAPINDIGQALEFLPKLLDFVSDISKRSPTIIPNHKKFKPSSALDIYRLLPGSNCHICGYNTCMAFAAALSRQYTSIINCPHIARPMEARVIYPLYDQHGNVVETVSFDIDADGMHQTINSKEAIIQDLQSRLASFEKDRVTNFDAANSALPTPLTKREIEVLCLIAHGLTNKEISADLQISTHTVKSHIIHIFNKIGVNDRAQTSAWGAKHGVL